MQQIGIDVRMAEHSGIGRYIRGIVGALAIRTSRFQYSLIGSERVQKNFPGGFPFVATNTPIYSLSEQVSLPKMAHSADCLHIPHYNAPLFWKRKLVVTIHDLIHLHFSNHLASPLARLYAQTLLPVVCKRADAIIAVSEYTKKDLVESLRIDPNKITVIHHGIDSKFLRTNGGTKNAPETSKPYFLYVGLIKTHKNLGTLIEAFLAFKKKEILPKLELHLIGKPDLKQKIVRKWLERIKPEFDILLRDKISEEELISEYRNALALIFPSAYEGFGFPLLEAMASGTPIIAAHAASIPEIAGEAALYFVPHSRSELENRMRQILNDATKRTELIAAGFNRLSLFDWKKAARETVNVYDSILSSN